MAIVRWEPFGRNMSPWHGFDTLRRRIGHLFDEYLPEESDTIRQSGWIPMVDISENDDNYILHVELPGMSKKDVKITFQDGVLTLSGEKKVEREKTQKTYHLVERSYGQFNRSFTLPSKVEADQIKADFKDGILNVIIPKAAEAKPRQIEIKVD